MKTKETFNRIKNILILFIKVILLFFVLLILSFYILISFIFHYSNQYTTIENFKSNKENFLEIKDDIVLNKFLLGQGGKKHCEDKEMCEYEYKLSDNEKKEKLNILYIRVSENKSLNYFNITFNLDKKGYFQSLSPILSFNSNTDDTPFGWYLPFPLSNKFLYIGSGYVDIDGNWTAYGHLDSAFD